MILAGGIVTICSVFPLAVLIFISVLEIAVGIAQAYVFCLLTSIYINDSVHLH